MSRMPFGALLAPRAKSDPAKQLKDYFTVIENEQDKEKKNYEEVRFLLVKTNRKGKEKRFFFFSF